MALGTSGLFQEAFGNEFVEAYIKLKTQAWNDYSRHLTKWELDTTLDC